MTAVKKRKTNKRNLSKFKKKEDKKIQMVPGGQETQIETIEVYNFIL